MVERRFRPRSIEIGKSRISGEKVMWSPKAQAHHAALFGTSGKGKSTLLTNILRRHVINGTGFCLIDPHGGLYDEMVSWLAFKGYDEKRTIHLIDPSSDDWRMGFNPLAANQGDLRAMANNVDYILEAISQAWGGEDINMMARYQRFLSTVLFAAAHKQMTLPETMRLLPMGRGDYREYVASDIPDHLQEDVWDEIRAFNDRQFQENFSSAFSRIHRFMRSYYIRDILGQHRDTIDFYGCMEAGDIVLVDLSNCENLTTASGQLLGKLIINNIFASSLRRTPNKSHPFHLIIDEAENLLSGDIPSILFQCRKFGLSLTLSIQDLSQLTQAGERVYGGVINGCQTKFVFGAGPKDAEELTHYVMPRGGYNLQEPIPIMTRPVAVGSEVRLVRNSSSNWSETESVTHTTSRGGGRSHTRAVARSEAIGHGDTQGSAISHSSGTTVMLPGDVLTTMYNLEDEEQHYTKSEGAPSTSRSTAVSEGRNQASSRSRVTSRALSQAATEIETWSEAVSVGHASQIGGSEGVSETYVTTYEDRPGQLYNIDQQRHRHTSALADQETGHLIVKVMSDNPIPVETKAPAKHLDKPERVEAFKKRVSEASQYISRMKDAALEQSTRARDLNNRVREHQSLPVIIDNEDDEQAYWG